MNRAGVCPHARARAVIRASSSGRKRISLAVGAERGWGHGVWGQASDPSLLHLLRQWGKAFPATRRAGRALGNGSGERPPLYQYLGMSQSVCGDETDASSRWGRTPPLHTSTSGSGKVIEGGRNRGSRKKSGRTGRDPPLSARSARMGAVRSDSVLRASAAPISLLLLAHAAPEISLWCRSCGPAYVSPAPGRASQTKGGMGVACAQAWHVRPTNSTSFVPEGMSHNHSQLIREVVPLLCTA